MDHILKLDQNGLTNLENIFENIAPSNKTSYLVFSIIKWHIF